MLFRSLWVFSRFYRLPFIFFCSYPAIYIITVLPVAAVRFRQFHSQNVSAASTVFCDILFSLSGFFNVLLFSVTRPALMPHRGVNIPEALPTSFTSNTAMNSARNLYELPGLPNTAGINVSISRTTWREGSIHSSYAENKDDTVNQSA